MGAELPTVVETHVDNNEIVIDVVLFVEI